VERAPATKRRRPDDEGDGHHHHHHHHHTVTTSSYGEEERLVGADIPDTTPATIGTLVDVLPYADPYSEADKRAALALIEQEMASFPPRADYLSSCLSLTPPLPPFLGGSEHLGEEVERVGRAGGSKEAGGGIGLDLGRYAMRRPRGGSQEEASQAAWHDAAEGARLALQHQHTRQTNLQLLEQFGPNAWLVYNRQLSLAHHRLEEELGEVRAAIETLNRARQEEQLAAGAKLDRAQHRWEELVRSNMELDVACRGLAGVVDELSSASSAPKVVPQ